MLDKWFRFIINRLDDHTAEVIAQRAKIERERAGDEARQHSGREFLNAEGFTTPLPKAFENAQNVYARTRRDFEANGGNEALGLLVAMLVARDKRDDAAAALRRYEEAEAARQDSGIHREVKPHYADAFKHGVEPRHLANVRQETRAITYDLIRWDGHDPDMQDPDNPMRQVFEIYASRLIVVPERFGDTSRSVPGTPVMPERDSDPAYYMFNELAKVGVATDTETDQTSPGDATASTAPVDQVVLEDASHLKADRIATPPLGDEPATIPGAVAELEPAAAAVADEYALPERFSAEDEQRIGQAARHFVESDPDWDYELQAAARWFHGGLTTAEIIERVEATPEAPDSTPFRHFVEAARVGGLSAGRDAYKIATIRRVMFEIVTHPSYGQARRNLGLEGG